MYAEDPLKNYTPSTGLLTRVQWPEGLVESGKARIETWVEQGLEISPWYDPMIAKVIVKGESRECFK